MNDPSNPNLQEAREALAMMGESSHQIRTAEVRDIGTYLLIWGIVYLAVPALVILLPSQLTFLCNGIVLLGVVATIIAAKRGHVHSPLASSILMFWWVIFAFCLVWIAILNGRNFPAVELSIDGRQTWAFGITVAMLMFVLIGFIGKQRLMTCLGFGVTIATVPAFYLAWDKPGFWLWMAASSGLPLTLSGIWCKTQKASEFPQ